ncbi:MAG TPA: TonB-dependent receptor, partial [Polyangiaceae bacterium]|nr:TonB-dependent receptor [Polyangiaceae bacterium]
MARPARGQVVSPAEPPAAAPVQAPAEGAPTEVSVHGARPDRDIGAHDIPAIRLRDVPGTFGDPFQAIAALPGMAPMASGLPYFYVRGAPPADTGYFLDGVPVPALFHIGPGPSIVPPALVERIDYFPSTPPARYGRFVGGVVAAETAPPSPTARAEASVRLFDASAFAEAPLGGGASALVAGRYGYPNLLLSLVAPHLSLTYSDYTLRVAQELGVDDAVSVLSFGAFDDEHDATQGLVPVDTASHRVDVRYDHKWREGSLRLATTLGYDRTAAPLASGADETASETSARVRLEVKQRLGAAARISAGADTIALLDGIAIGDAHPDPNQIAGAYVDAQWRPAERVEVAAGVRVDAYRSPSGAIASLDPKLAVRVRVTSRVVWTSSVGVAHQAPTYLLPVPGLRLDPASGLQTAYEYAEGVEVTLPEAVKVGATAFYAADRRMNDFVSDCGGFLLDCSVVGRVDGSTVGLEVLVERSLSRRLGGFLSYTLSRAERRVGAVTFLSPFDRTHVASAVLRYDFGRGVAAGVRGTYMTGRADIPSLTYPGQPIDGTPPSDHLVQHRLPFFYRLDLRLEKRWNISDRAWLTAVVE